MKEIKFRAYNKYSQKMYEVEWISFRHNNIIVASNEEAEKQQKLWDFELMQFTGLKDKNWKDVFEGDILRIEGKNVFVYYNDDGLYELWWEKTLLKGLALNKRAWIPFEIIWNIYENPELLNN